jgi:hypothetical protein
MYAAAAVAFHVPEALVRVRDALRWVAQHTGVPVLVLAAIALVVSYRLVKSSTRLVVEVLVVLMLLVVATKLGWLRW